MENRPVKTLGIIWGAGMGRYHRQDMADLRQSFCGPQTEEVFSLGDGVKNPPLRDVTDMFREVCRPDAGRGLIVILADARHDILGTGSNQPLQTGKVSQVEAWLFELNRTLRHQMKRATPVDVFVLAAQQFDLRRHVQRLPSGSVGVSIKSPAHIGTANSARDRNGWLRMLQGRKDKDAPWPVSPGAKELLLDYLLSDGPLARARSHKSFRMPQTAVPGHYSQATITDVWRNITEQKTGDEDIITCSVQRLDTLQQLMGYRPDLINQVAECLLGGKKTSCPADYAGALLAGRADLFGLDSDWSWIDRLAAAKPAGVDIDLPRSDTEAAVRPLQDARIADCTTGEQTPYEAIVRRGRVRLSAREVAALPAKLRPLAQLPAVRKILRKP